MSLKATWYRDKLRKKAKRGFQGYPIATIVYYGPNDQRASKVAVGVTREEGGDTDPLERWFTDDIDTRQDPGVTEAIVHFLQQHGVKSVVLLDRILGCPHEEGIDYPDGEKCPTCPFWAIRDRVMGSIIR